MPKTIHLPGPQEIIIENHRNFQLAEKRRKKLEKKFGFAVILSRRNQLGRFSISGHKFVFLVGKGIEHESP